VERIILFIKLIANIILMQRVKTTHYNLYQYTGRYVYYIVQNQIHVDETQQSIYYTRDYIRDILYKRPM